MTSKVLCRYWLHGACRYGDTCTFSHSLEDAESDVCRYYLKGQCAYGDRCRYMHVKPDWAQKRDSSSGIASSYVAPTVPRPAVDDLADQLPISRLRLSGQAASTSGSAAAGPSSTGRSAGLASSYAAGVSGQGWSISSMAGSPSMPMPLPLPLRLDATNARAGTSNVGGAASAVADEEQWEEEWGEQQHPEEHNWQRQCREWTEEAAEGKEEEREESWEQGDAGEEEYWEEGAEGEWGEAHEAAQDAYWEEAGGEGDEGSWEEQEQLQQQHAGLQLPAAAGNTDEGQQQEERAWALPAVPSEQQQWAASCPSSLRSLCQEWFRSGMCCQGKHCKLVHGELCPHCHKHALHPADEAARDQHLSECKLRHERLAARARSAGIECGICLEPVLSKAAPGDRRFGLLTGCDHPFCLRCIRSWRQKTDAGADVDTALRTCPVCRTTSHYTVPSMVWPSDSEEKERIVGGYRAKLGSIDCMHFNFGEGTCPFGTSCFYRHAYPDGRLEEPTLRRIVDDEGVRVVQPVRLSDFISISAEGQRLIRR